MTDDVVDLRLRVTDPARWHALARSWRQWAAVAGRLAAEFGPLLARLSAAWSGAAARAAAERLHRLRRRLVLFRVLCWRADQALSEFAAALDRARRLLPGPDAPPVAARADAAAAGQLAELEAATRTAGEPPPPGRPSCLASPAAVRQWWERLTLAQRQWLVATEPGWLAPLDGVPAVDRDAANRLLLDDRRTELAQAIGRAGRGDRDRLRDLRHGLDTLADRLASEDGPRAYLLRLDLAGEGRAVVALGDPDRADNVLTQVPGMTADLTSYGGELARAERIAVRAAELGPRAATSTVMWLDYDAPDFLDEAASARRATAAAPTLRRFQEGLRATHDGPPARQTVLGHSYGSLVVGTAAAGAPMAADSIVFVGSPGVGVDSASALHAPAGQVWSSTSRSDVIQYAALSPGGLLREVAAAQTGPLAGPLLALGHPERELWFGHNPSDPAFGARVFASQPDGGHVGYWDRGRPALDALTAIALGRTP
jgi:alpha/beta hydrolase family protein